MANTKKKLTQLDRIENSVKTLAKHVKSQDAMLVQFLHQLIAGQNKMMNNDLDTHSNLALLKPPVEEVKEWVPKVGEYFVSTHDNSKVSGNYKWSNVLMLALVGKTRKCLDHLGGRVYDGEFYWTAKDLRPATPEEIATYEQEKEWAKVTELQEGDVPKPH